jgi:hypothetical protein
VAVGGREKQVADSLPAHALEKSAANLSDVSIHRLYATAKVGVRWWGSRVVMGISKGYVIALRCVLLRCGQ